MLLHQLGGRTKLRATMPVVVYWPVLTAHSRYRTGYWLDMHVADTTGTRKETGTEAIQQFFSHQVTVGWKQIPATRQYWWRQHGARI